MTEPIQVRIHPELVKALDARADAEGMARNEYWAKLLAEAIGCPELAAIPRKRMGRPRNRPEPEPAAS